MDDFNGYKERQYWLEWCEERSQDESLIRYQETFTGAINEFATRFTKFVPANHPRELSHGCFPNMAYPVTVFSTKNIYGDPNIGVAVSDIDDGAYVGHYDTEEEALAVFNAIRYGFTREELIALGMEAY